MFSWLPGVPPVAQVLSQEATCSHDVFHSFFVSHCPLYLCLPSLIFTALVPSPVPAGPQATVSMAQADRGYPCRSSAPASQPRWCSSLRAGQTLGKHICRIFEGSFQFIIHSFITHSWSAHMGSVPLGSADRSKYTGHYL